MPQGAVPLAGYPGETVTITCEACGFRQAWPFADLARRYGPVRGLPELLGILTTDCPRREETGLAQCRAVFAELARR